MKTIFNSMKHRFRGQPPTRTTDTEQPARPKPTPRLCEDQKRESLLSVPDTKTEEAETRPYFQPGDSISLPPREVYAEIYRRCDSGPPELLPGELDVLRKLQKQIDRLTREIAKTSVNAIDDFRRAAKRRLHRGRGSTADAQFNIGNLIQARKAMKRVPSVSVRRAQKN